MLVYFKKTIKLTIAIFTLGLLFVFSTLWYFSSDLPDYKILANYKPPISSRVHSGEGQLIAEYALQKRLFIPYDSVPKNVIYSFLSAEDKNFFSHPGVDAKSITRATIKNVRNIFSEKRLEGASTITQQVAKNFLLTNEVSIKRKIKEAILAKATTPELKAIAIKEGFRTMHDMGRELILSGDLNFPKKFIISS